MPDYLGMFMWCNAKLSLGFPSVMSCLCDAKKVQRQISGAVTFTHSITALFRYTIIHFTSNTIRTRTTRKMLANPRIHKNPPILSILASIAISLSSEDFKAPSASFRAQAALCICTLHCWTTSLAALSNLMASLPIKYGPLTFAVTPWCTPYVDKYST